MMHRFAKQRLTANQHSSNQQRHDTIYHNEQLYSPRMVEK